jgi:hypothetical protein
MLQEVTAPCVDRRRPDDFVEWLAARDGRPRATDVLNLVERITAALADLHFQGCAHGSLCPFNVRLASDGAVIEYPPVDDAEPDYTPPERKTGQSAVPRHDLYAVGVLWAKLLAGDLTYKLHPGWSRELEVAHGASRTHLDIISRCVGWVGDRPADAGELTTLIDRIGERDTSAGDLPLVPLESAVAATPPRQAVGVAGTATALNASERDTVVSRLRRVESLLTEEGKRRASGNVPIGPLVIGGIVFVVVYLCNREPHGESPAAMSFGCGLGVFVLAWICALLGSNEDGNERRAAATKVITPLLAEYPRLFVGWEDPKEWTSQYAGQVRQLIERREDALLDSGPVATSVERGDVSQDSPPPNLVRRASTGTVAVQQPHRGWIVITVAILGLPLPLLAPVAWAMGNADLKSMENGSMERAGRTATHAGYFIGACLTLLYGVIILLAVLSKL